MIKCIFAFFKKKSMTRKILAVVVLLTVLASCASRDKLRYYQGIAAAVENDSITYNPILKQDDLLTIYVSSPNAEAAVDFNVASYGLAPAGNGAGATGAGSSTSQVQLQYKSYLIDNEGNIEFPVLGRLKLGGLTKSDALMLLKSKLKVYIKDPSVTLRIVNFKISVQGEVTKPASFPITTERITLPEALSMAGDLTIYGRRDNILVIREIDGKKSYNFVDLTKADFINSPFYYLSQNDVVYVEPNKVRMNGSTVGPNITVILTSLSLLLAIYTVYTRN